MQKAVKKGTGDWGLGTANHQPLSPIPRSLPLSLWVRVVTSAILIPLTLIILYAESWVFNLFILLVSFIMALEWQRIIRHKTHSLAWEIAGIFYIFIPCVSIMWLASLANGREIILWIFITTWATDSFAYIVGKLIGGAKIAPSISPKKTWAGLIGGISGAALFGGYGLHFIVAPFLPLIFCIALSASFAILSQAGDFLESWIKRQFGVKDSGHIIPGHGGILDRVDGLVPFIPVVALFIWALQ